jgi:alkanesulfonate monooxygenase SsuD/methylene tetrahydromethanopterin reductase-like flavin-dependent oxidoreductase (luciferase family)
MTVRLGVTLPQFTQDAARFREAALEAEELGFDSVWVFDHMWPLTGGRERPALEAWSCMGWLAAATERITIGTSVTRSSLRHPAVLAHMAACVADIAPGRLVMGIGSGDDKSRAENEAFGIDYWAEEERVDQLRSTVELVLAYLSGKQVTKEDDFVTVRDLPARPPAERPAIWVAGRADATLEVAAHLADGWNAWGGTPSDFAVDAGSVLEMAAGRDILLTWSGLVPQGTDPVELRDRLLGYVEAGARHLILTFEGRLTRQRLQSVASEVLPALRAAGAT